MSSQTKLCIIFMLARLSRKHTKAHTGFEAYCIQEISSTTSSSFLTFLWTTNTTTCTRSFHWCWCLVWGLQILLQWTVKPAPRSDWQCCVGNRERESVVLYSLWKWTLTLWFSPFQQLALRVLKIWKHPLRNHTFTMFDYVWQHFHPQEKENYSWVYSFNRNTF